MFHRHIPDYLSPTVSHLGPRQRNLPNNAERRINIGGGWLVKPGCLLLPSSLEHYIYNRSPRNHSYYFIYPTDKPFGTSGDLEVENGESISFGADRVEREVLNHYQHDSKAHPPFVCPRSLAYMHIQLLGVRAKCDVHVSGFKVSL